MTDPSARITRCPQAARRAGLPAGRGATVARTFAVRATVPPWCPPVSTRGSGPAVKPAPRRADLTGRAEWSWMPAVSGAGQPAPPAGIRAGRSTPGNARGAHEVTARDHPHPPLPAFPSGRAGRVRTAPPRSSPAGLSFLPRSAAGRSGAACRRRPGGGRA